MALIPENLGNLHAGEEELRKKALGLLAEDSQLILHLSLIEHAMDLADILRQYDTDDENLKVVQVLGMRIFNAFGAAVKLTMSGYFQNAALILRDVLETVFLLDLFRTDPALIEQWRFADKAERQKHFRPIKVRERLDDRDGFTERKRAAVYELFSELAAHATMKSAWMMRPEKEGDAVVGPFMAHGLLQAVLSESGRLAVQVGEILDNFFPSENHGAGARAAFNAEKRRWIRTFYKAKD